MPPRQEDWLPLTRAEAFSLSFTRLRTAHSYMTLYYLDPKANAKSLVRADNWLALAEQAAEYLDPKDSQIDKMLDSWRIGMKRAGYVRLTQPG